MKKNQTTLAYEFKIKILSIYHHHSSCDCLVVLLFLTRTKIIFYTFRICDFIFSFPFLLALSIIDSPIGFYVFWNECD